MVKQKCRSQEFLYALLLRIIYSPLASLNKYIEILLKTYVKHEDNNAKNSTTISNYIRNVVIQDDKIMVSFDITFLYTDIPIIDTLNIIKDYINNDDQFTWKTAIVLYKFLDLVNLVLITIWYTINSQFYQQTDNVAMRGPASSPTAKIYMQAHELSTVLSPPKVWEQFGDDIYSILKRMHLENLFPSHQQSSLKYTFPMEEESNGELAILDTLLKRNNGKMYCYIESLCILNVTLSLNYNSHHHTSCNESVVSLMFNSADSIITNKDARIKQNVKGE